ETDDLELLVGRIPHVRSSTAAFIEDDADLVLGPVVLAGGAADVTPPLGRVAPEVRAAVVQMDVDRSA
ncbi:hypothetical protein, partial [Falsiroseomonas sp. E2-1-a20]|uniref:hypothetical protein n=1 Tax=Falsiroseomonas sp. E2-1-a20 TaxID=3239300 RepID=UPI003F3B386C